MCRWHARPLLRHVPTPKKLALTDTVAPPHSCFRPQPAPPWVWKVEEQGSGRAATAMWTRHAGPPARWLPALLRGPVAGGPRPACPPSQSWSWSRQMTCWPMLCRKAGRQPRGVKAARLVDRALLFLVRPSRCDDFRSSSSLFHHTRALRCVATQTHRRTRVNPRTGGRPAHRFSSYPPQPVAGQEDEERHAPRASLRFSRGGAHSSGAAA